MIEWINLKDKKPEYNKIVLVAYIDKNRTNRGIATGLLQYDGSWLVDNSLKGEYYDSKFSIITHWCNYINYLNYPKTYV